MNLLVTGASGFVGSKATIDLSSRGFSVTAFSRSNKLWPRRITSLSFPSLKALCADHTISFEKFDCILHLAGRAHVLREKSPNPISLYRQSNLFDTINLATTASRAGVKRFILVSTIKVNGDSNLPSQAFTEDSTVNPSDPYSLSKYEAELALRDICLSSGMQFVIVRPPLVYGPNVKANFKSLIKLLKLNLPLPLASLNTNLRSFISLDNFIDFLSLVISHPAAANELFLVSDQHDLSTVDLLKLLCLAMDIPCHLFPFPPKLLALGSSSFGNRVLFDRLHQSLVINSTYATKTLDWSPPHSVLDGFRSVVSTSIH